MDFKKTLQIMFLILLSSYSYIYLFDTLSNDYIDNYLYKYFFIFLILLLNFFNNNFIIKTSIIIGTFFLLYLYSDDYIHNKNIKITMALFTIIFIFLSNF